MTTAMALYWSNLDFDLDLDQTPVVQRGSIKKAVQVQDQVQVEVQVRRNV
jgi:hypothetical protein